MQSLSSVYLAKRLYMFWAYLQPIIRRIQQLVLSIVLVRTIDSHLKRTISTTYIHMVYLLILGYRYTRNMQRCLAKNSEDKLCIKLVLLYGSETWTTKARDNRRITAAEMKYMRRTAGYTWTDYKTNTQIRKGLKTTPILDKLLEYKRDWIQHVNTRHVFKVRSGEPLKITHKR